MARAVLVGQAASPGRGIGRALLVATRRADVALGAAAGFPFGPSDAATPPDPDEEARRLQAASEAAARELEALASTTPPAAGADAAGVLEAQALLAADPALLGSALQGVAAGMTAKAALQAAVDRHVMAIAALDDPLLRARAADVRDVGGRILRCLSGGPEPGLWHADDSPAVLIADDLMPSEVATVRPEGVAALALANGSLLGHAAIVARALEIPLVVGLGAAILRVDPGAFVLVDGSGGSVVVEPDPDEVADSSGQASSNHSTAIPG
jgi:phosphoenolpyruvate-protein kinase (PTS system EI component)